MTNDYRGASSALENVRRMVGLCRETCVQMQATTSARPIQCVGIVGAGIMGTAIAIEHAVSAIPVILMDKDPAALQLAATSAAVELAAIERNGRCNLRQQPITYTLDAADLGRCDLVLESIVEKRPAKQALYAQIEKCRADGAILATNTSTIPVTRLAGNLTDPARFCGLHFCHPVRIRPLVEVISGPATSPETVATVAAHAALLGKLPMVVADGPGFVVNRLLMTYLNAALDLVALGMSIEQIDVAMVAFGMPLGPLELLDEIGLDTALQSGIVLEEVFGERSGGSELLVRLVKSKQFGTKAGAGFYRYPGKTPNPSCEEAIESLGTSSTRIGERSTNPATIAQRLLKPMASEAIRLLDEKKVSADWQIELVMIFGLGFPLWRGGLLWWSNHSRLKL